jgi:hypothetical protein
MGPGLDLWHLSSDPFAMMYFMGIHSREIVCNRGYVTRGHSADNELSRVMANGIVVKAFTPVYHASNGPTRRAPDDGR